MLMTDDIRYTDIPILFCINNEMTVEVRRIAYSQSKPRTKRSRKTKNCINSTRSHVHFYLIEPKL